MKDIRYKIAYNIKKIRNKHGITQIDLADKAGLHYNYISRIENVNCNISVLILEKLAKALEVKIQDLIK